MNKNARKDFNLGYTIHTHNADMDQLMELIYQSNLIEGISDYWIGTVSEGQELKIKPTITDHIDTLVLVNERSHLDINNEEVRRVHNSLMHQLMDKSGEYRKEGNSYMATGVGDFILGNPLPEHIPKLMDSWIEKTRKVKKFDELLNLHYEYEVIHPFGDGNGRSGRLLLNWLTLQNLDAYTVIEKQHVNKYYKNIQDYRQEFIKSHPEIIFTTYKMLPKEEKERLEKRKQKHNEMMYNIFKK